MATNIPAKQLHVTGATPDELKSRLLDRETGWCESDKSLYYKDGEELRPVGGSSLPGGGTVGQVLKRTQAGAAWGDVTLENGKTIDEFAEEVAEEFDSLKSRGCIYFNKKTGSDDNDGLTRETPVKTEQKLVQLLREKEYDRIFLTKTIASSPEESYDDSGTSEVVIDTGIAYKWKRLHIGGEGDSIKVIFGTLSDVPDPSSGVSANLDAVFIESESAIAVTGTTVLPVNIFVKQTGEASAYKSEGIDFTDLRINGLNSVVPFDPRDYSLRDIKIFAESVGDISGYIGINVDAAQGYNFLRDRIGTVSFKSEKTVTANIRGCDHFIIRADSVRYTYSLDVAKALDIQAATRCEVGGQVLAGTDKECASVVISGGAAPDSYLNVANVLPYYDEEYNTDCAPIVDINWAGTVEHTGLIRSCQYKEKVGKYADAANGLNLTAYYYGGYDSNGDLIIRNSPVYIESDGEYRIEQITTYADGQSGYHTPVYVISNGDLTLLGGTASATIMSMATFIQATGNINSPQRPIVLMPAYANGTTDLVRMPYKSTLRSVNGSVIIRPYVSDYCALQQLNAFAENGTVQILNNLQLLQLNVKAAELTLPNPIYTAELHVDAKVLNVYGTNGRFEIYGYGYEDTQFPWSEFAPVTNSTIKADTLNWLGNVQGIVKFNMRDADTSLRNLDVQISTIISSSGWSSGKCCPILGDMAYYNGEVTGEIGSIVIVSNGQVQKRSRWTRDLIFYDNDSDDNTIVSKHWKPTARVSLHLADRSSPTDLFIDASLGDDRYDGLTASRPVRSIRGLYRALKLNFNPAYNHNNGVISFYNPITLHVLSAVSNGFRGAATDTPSTSSPFDIDFHVNSTLVDDSSLTAGKDYEIYMNFIEILPEEPNLSVRLNRLNTGVLYAHGFYGFAVSKFYNNSLAYIDSTEKLAIDNRKVSGDDAQYYYDYSDARVSGAGMCTFKSKYITLNGLFYNLYAEATQRLYLDGTSSAVISNSNYDAVAGISILKSGEEITFGGYNNLCGIGARTFVECNGDVKGEVRALRGDVSIKCSGMSANLGTSYMNVSLKIDAKNVFLSSSCFCATWSTTYGSEITLNADRVSGSSSGISLCNATLHANVRDWFCPLSTYSNGNGVLDIKAAQWAGSISMHYLSKVSIDIGTLQNTISFSTGGPNTPSAAMTTNAVIKIGKFNSSSYVLGIPHNDSQYLQKDIVLDVGQTNGPLVSWGGDGSSLVAPTRLRVTANGTAIPGDSAYSNFGKRVPANCDCVITILKELVAGNGISITEDTNSKTISADIDIVSKSVTVETGSTDGSVTLDNYKYNAIAAVPAAVTDLTINIPAASAGKLQECAFQFSLADNAALASVTAKMVGQELPMIAPSAFVSGKIYQGTSVNGLVTIAEFTAPPQGVVIGGRFYPTVTIGNQEWLAENLDLKFTGLDIGSSGSPQTTAAWYYDNDESTYGESGNKYGLLYNWDAASYIETNKSTLLPDGWHVPTKTELETLLTTVGGASVAGTKLKSTSGWTSGDGDGSYGFEAFPAGCKKLVNAHSTNDFRDVGNATYFWTTTANYSYTAYRCMLDTTASATLTEVSQNAFSVRLVRTIS